MEKITFLRQENKPSAFSGSYQRFSFTNTEKGWNISGVRAEPERLQHETPILYATGWGATVDIHKNPIQLLAQKGYEVIAINPPRNGKGRKKDMAGFSLPAIEIAKAEAVVETMKKQWIHPGHAVNIVAHSEGGIYGAISALLAVQQGIHVKNLVLVAPGGFIGKDAAYKLIPRFFFNAAVEERYAKEKDVPANKRLRRTEAIKALTHPILSLQEAHAIAHTPLKTIVQELAHRGVCISVIQGKQDIVFPIEKMEQQAETAGINYFYEGDGGHNAVIVNAPTYTQQIDNVLQRRPTR